MQLNDLSRNVMGVYPRVTSEPTVRTKFQNFLRMDPRALLPRERRRISVRELSKGVTGHQANRPQSKHERKYAQRRLHRRLLIQAAIDGWTENPAGAKRILRYAKVAGFGVEENGKMREPTYMEAAAWYRGLEEAPFKEGQRLRTEAEIWLQHNWKMSRMSQPAVRVH